MSIHKNIGCKSGDTNLYAYVGGDPMSYVDPTGLKVRTCKRKLNHKLLPKIGPLYHEYIEFDDGEIFSFGPKEGENPMNANAINIPESRIGADCTEWSENSLRDEAIKKERY